jgi:dipeptidyl aminopeptidase/acylaminoacyl peptidase
MGPPGRRLPALPGLPPLPRLPRLPGVVGPALSAAGLLVVAALSYALLTGNLPVAPGGGGDGGPVKTPTPSNIVIVDPRSNVLGTMAYVKDGNLWLQSGATASQLTSGGRDAMPTWSADGTWIYFVRTSEVRGKWPVAGVVRDYGLDVPSIVRIHPDGSGLETLFSGRIRSGSYTWSAFARQPVPSPDGTRLALVTDYPDPAHTDLLLKILNLKNGSISDLGLPEVPFLGHQDPAWSPDGSAILYVKNARAGARGAPTIQRYDLSTKKVKALTPQGYLEPAWSPDGRYVAATKTGSFGTDVVILDARTGNELLRVTSDEASFAPTWSPAGNAIAFFRVDRGVVDLVLVRLDGTAPSWLIGETIALTVNAGLDAASRPSWFIPADELPTPPPTVQPSTQPFPTLRVSPSASPSA